MGSPFRRLKKWEETAMSGLLLSGCMLTVAGVAIPIWAVVDPGHLLDGSRVFALIAAPFALLVGIRRLRRAADMQ
jgi:hypothetical protein